MPTTKTTIVVADGIQLIHVRLPIFAFDIFAQIQIANGEIHKSVKFVLQISAI